LDENAAKELDENAAKKLDENAAKESDENAAKESDENAAKESDENATKESDENVRRVRIMISLGYVSDIFGRAWTAIFLKLTKNHWTIITEGC